MAEREYLRVRNWSKYQHYKSGKHAATAPAWIKLYMRLLRDYEFSQLEDATKWHFVGILLLAAQHENRIPADSMWISRELGATVAVDIPALLNAGLIEPYDKSRPLDATLSRPPINNRSRPEVEVDVEKKDLGLGAVSLKDFFQGREPDPALRNPRSLSIPKDPSVLAETVYAWLLSYWPEERIGAGMPVAIRTWQGTIPGFMEQAAALKRELETADYGKPGDPVRWRDLSFSDQRGKIALSLNSLKKVAESR